VESDLPEKAIQIRTASALDRGSGSRLLGSDGFEIVQREQLSWVSGVGTARQLSPLIG
jgi:hypothetical protein